jgi:lipoate-protein ligase A
METWFLLRSGAAPAALNMAVDETLLQQVHHLDNPVLRFYAWSEPAASFGYFQRFADVTRATSLRPLVRRPTGGGIVPHDCDWTYSLVFPPHHPWYGLKAIESYRRVHDWVQAAFEELGIKTELASTTPTRGIDQCFAGAAQFDVLLGEQKIAGAAQRRTRSGLLIQGSIQPPPETIRSAWQQSFCDRAARRWQVQWREWHLPADLEHSARQLAKTKYSQPAFNERR